MGGVWFEEYERLWNESDGEPSPEAVNEAVSERFAVQADRLRDQWKERDIEW